MELAQLDKMIKMGIDFEYVSSIVVPAEISVVKEENTSTWFDVPSERVNETNICSPVGQPSGLSEDNNCQHIMKALYP